MGRHIGERIAALRIEHREQQAELAAAIGCTPGAISHIERGRRQPSKDMLFAIARHYGVSADWLELGVLPPADPVADLIAAIRAAPPDVLDAIRALLRVSQRRRD